MAQEKIRIYQLASQLNIQTKDLLELCQKHGLDVRNQLSTLDQDQRDRVVELVRRGPSAPVAPSKPVKPTLPVEPQRKIEVLPPTKRTAPGPRDSKPADAAPPAPPIPEPSPVQEMPEPPASQPISPPEPELQQPSAPPPQTSPVLPPAAESKPAPEPPVQPAPPPAADTRPAAPVLDQPVPPSAPAASAPTMPPASEPPPGQPKPPQQPAAAKPQTPPPAPEQPRPPAAPPRGDRQMKNLGGPPRPQTSRPPERKSPQTQSGSRSGGGAAPRMAAPPPQKARPAGEEKKPTQPPPSKGPVKLGNIPTDFDASKPIRIEDLLRPPTRPPAGGAAAVPDEVAEDDEDKDKKAGARRPGSVIGRDKRHQDRQARAKERVVRGADGKGILVEDERPQARGLHRQRRPKPPGTLQRKGRVPIELPITVRSLSEAMGLNSVKLLMQLIQHGAPAKLTINSTLDADLAEALALENGCELDVKRPPDAEEELREQTEKPDEPESLVLRAPIVTIMGHVDHGKTSLLDRIRESNIVDTEAGGITQVLRAWRVDHGGKPITFLDTPGHEAFTKMRARGANVTDIAVIVVAATDGVMPQTEEAISHAKAAEVAIIVAINKIDMPNATVANIRRTEQQLYNLGLIPDTMGGDVQFVKTSAITGEGIDTLLDTISLVAEFRELKANPNKPARGTCLEASVNEGEGVMATILVRDGTLRRGDVLLCGAAYGRVRAMYDDMQRPIEEAGPSIPCRVTGLDEIPNADDPFAVVEDLLVAREIADKRKSKAQEAALTHREPMGIESLTQLKVTELKIVLKADVKGSVEAIKKELEKLQHDEVRCRILHTGIGAINESDVTLAMISPSDTLIVGFNVVPDDAARELADSRSIKIHEYKIIYELTGDIRAALEGKLKPREEIVHLGRAVVRETFKISRVGTIAGCRVTQGAMERSAKVRVIRNGVVIYPPAERTAGAGLDSLKRFKEDVREVQQGYECGLKISGYDDVKVDDVIECYRIDQVQRTLS